MSDVQQRYDKLIDEMPIHVKVARAAEMFQWSRHEEPVRQLIEKALSHVAK